MGKRWRIYPHDPDRIARLERSAGLPAVIAQLLVCRGIDDPAQAKAFLEARLANLRPPEELPGVDQAVDCIASAIDAKKRTVIYGDYDADGMTATAILLRCLKLLGGNVGYYVPNRITEGYGLKSDALETLASRDARVVVTVDCGIASVSEALAARRLGLELIVTDHHECGATLPAADAIVHPRLPGRAYPFGGLCGAGVALKLVWALCQRASRAKKVGPAMRKFLLSAVGLAALGTVADVVPLIDENRVLVRHGLRTLREEPVPGIAALMKITELDKKPQLASEDVAFTLAPRLNAAGRLGQAQLAVELLETESPARAESLARYIHQLNETRATLERGIYRAANKQAREQFNLDGDPALVLAAPGWHPGVIGIVAGRLAEKYDRPVVLVALDRLGVRPGSGSARSAGGVNLHRALSACGDHLISHGGHAQAAGLKIDPSRLDHFRAEFCEYVAGEIAAADHVAELLIDAETPLIGLTLKTVAQIQRLAPFGQGNPRPVLCAAGVTLADAPKRIGGGQRHLSLKLRQHRVTMRGVGFGHGDWAEPLERVGGPLDVAFRPVINDFRGRRSVELHLVDWRPAKTTAAVGPL